MPENGGLNTGLAIGTIFLLLLLLSGDVELNPGPNDLTENSSEISSDFFEKFLEKSITLVHLNVQSLTNKLDIIQAEFGGFDIITLNETWIDYRSTSDDLLIQGFQEPFRRDRTNNRYGGVIIYVNSNIPCRRRYDIEVDQVECIWVECVIHKKKYLI